MVAEMEIDAFRGIRYATSALDDLASVTAPPYDAIDEGQQRTLHEADPHNVVRLELGLDREADGQTTNRYERSAVQYAAWRSSGVLVRDGDRPRLHAYEQSFTDLEGRPRSQIGFLAALQLAPWDAGIVLPHERVFRGPVEDRKRLLRALPVNVSPVFILYENRSEAVEEAFCHIREQPPGDDFRCEDGIRHRHWPLESPGLIARIRSDLADRVGLMADGHHRYTSALEYRDEAGAPRGAAAILAYVVCEQDGPELRANHRLVRRLPTGWRHELSDVGISVGRSWQGIRPELAVRELQRNGAGFGLVTRHRTEVLAGPPPRALVPSDTPATLADLDVVALQHILLDRLGVPDHVEDLRYVSEMAAAVAAVGRGDAEALFLLRPLRLDQVRAAASAGIRLPPKSTSFHPKPRTGLVLRPLDPRTG